ncbi:MAG TPA: NAD(P)-dependent alcohol dehydrogenase, partial [Actinomycetota bacterium]
HAAGLDPGVWHLMTGRPYMVRLMPGLHEMKVPIRGRDVAGRVEAVGSGVSGFARGDEVMGIVEGSFAELAVARPDKLVRKPANVSLEQAAAVPISGLTALQALRDEGRVRPGQRVLIVGAGGGVGTFAVQIARAFGAHVTGVAGSDKLDLVRSIGADVVIDYTREDFADGARAWDVIVDTAGRSPLRRLRRALARTGTAVLVGGEGGGPLLGGFDRQIVRAPLMSLAGKQRFRSLTSEERLEDLVELAGLIEAGKVVPVVGRTYPLAEVPDALRELERGHARGKTVIRVVEAA